MLFWDSLTALFLTLLRMSMAATLAAGVVCLASALLGWLRAPRRIACLLWLVVLFRLLCPVSFTAGFSLMSLPAAVYSAAGPLWATEIAQASSPSEQMPTPAAIPGTILETSPALPDNRIPPSADSPSPVSSVPTPAAQPQYPRSLYLLSLIWLAGIAILLLHSAVSYLLLRRKIATAIRSPQYGDRVYISEQITAPFVCGFLRPKIYLPTPLQEREISYILLHEQTHIRHGDHLLKPVCYLAVCLHWFNPLLWLSLHSMMLDMECGCDEAVLNALGSSVKKDYSASLLALASRTSRRQYIGSPLAFGENPTRARIKRILKYHRPTVITVVCAVLLCVSAAAIALANPHRPAEPAMEETVASDLQIQIDALQNQEIAGRILTDCAEGNAGDAVLIRADQGFTLPDGLEAGQRVNVQYQTLIPANDHNGSVTAYLAASITSLTDYPTAFAKYDHQGNLVSVNVLYNQRVSTKMAQLLLSSTQQQELDASIPDAESYLQITVGLGSNRVYNIFQKDGICYLERPMEYRAILSQEIYDEIYSYLYKNELPPLEETENLGQLLEGPQLPKLTETYLEETFFPRYFLSSALHGGLNWETFSDFYCIRSQRGGLLLQEYPVEGERGLCILLGGSNTASPLKYAYLQNDRMERLDLMQLNPEDLESFLLEQPAGLPVSTIQQASSSQTQADSSAGTSIPIITYSGAKILEAYSYDPDAHSYHRISDQKRLQLAAETMEKGNIQQAREKASGGFLLFTEAGRVSYYLDEQEPELLELCRANNLDTPHLAQWLVYMNIHNLQKALFEGEMISELQNGLATVAVNASEISLTSISGGKTTSVSHTSDTALYELAGMLKSLPVNAPPTIYDPQDYNLNSNYDPNRFKITLGFSTGVTYSIFGDRTQLCVMASDMSTMLCYPISKESYGTIKNWIAALVRP